MKSYFIQKYRVVLGILNPWTIKSADISQKESGGFMKTVLLTLVTLISTSGFAQEMSTPDNQCRIQAKEIALKTYQSCITETRAVKIEQIRQEYQEKIAELKKQYEAQILELKTASAASSSNLVPSSESSSAETSGDVSTSKGTTPSPEMESSAPSTEATGSTETLPTMLLDESPASVEPAQKNNAVESQNLLLTEPTVTLKPASNTATSRKVSKSKKALNPSVPAQNKKGQPVVAQKRTTGQKGVKGIAKTLPTKQSAQQ